MYGLRPTVTALRGLWGSRRYWVGINGMPLIWDLLCVYRSLFCNTSLGGVSRSWLMVSLCCVVYLRSINLCIYMYFYVNNGLIPFRLPLASMVCGFFFRVEGERCLFSPIVAMGFLFEYCYFLYYIWKTVSQRNNTWTALWLDDFWKRAGTRKFYDRIVWFLTSIYVFRPFS